MHLSEVSEEQARADPSSHTAQSKPILGLLPKNSLTTEINVSDCSHLCYIIFSRSLSELMCNSHCSVID